MDDSHLNHSQEMPPSDDINQQDEYRAQMSSPCLFGPAEQPALRQAGPEVISSGDRAKASLPGLKAPAIQPAEKEADLKVIWVQDGAKTSPPGLFAAAGPPDERAADLKVIWVQDGAKIRDDPMVMKSKMVRRSEDPPGLFAAAAPPDERAADLKVIWVQDGAKTSPPGLFAAAGPPDERGGGPKLISGGDSAKMLHPGLTSFSPPSRDSTEDRALWLTRPLNARVIGTLFEDGLIDTENTFVKQVFSENIAVWSNHAQAGSGLGALNTEHASNVGHPDTSQIVTGFKMTVQVRRDTCPRGRSDFFQDEDPDDSMEQPGMVSVRKQRSLHPLSQPRVSKKRAASKESGSSRPTRAAKQTQPKAKNGGTVVINGNPQNCQFLTTEGDAPILMQQNYFIRWG